MIRQILTAGLIALTVSGFTYGQINLGSISSNMVKVGGRVDTKLDTVLIDTKIYSGSAITSITIVAKPSASIDTSGPIPQNPDSIEMSTAFCLPTDFVADSMWLWIDGKAVEAKIQDRALALGQYTQIVGKRRDPALLEFSGNGNYSLRIFPAELGRARKIKIQFHHTFDDSANLITAYIPVVYDSTNLLRYFSTYRQIGFVSASFSCNDFSKYNVNFPGIGTGSFSKGQSLVLSSSNVSEMQVATISSNDPSESNEYLWIGHDKHTNKVSAGITVQIDESNVQFEKEPDTRIIALDIRNRTWNWNDYYKAKADYLKSRYTVNTNYQDIDVLARAQKYAILCLENYLRDNDKFNVILGANSVQTLFEGPVPAHPEYIKAAVEAILKYSPDSSSSTGLVMDEAVEQASSGIVILISDLFEPYNYYDNQNYPMVYTESDAGAEYNAAIDHLSALTDSSDITLFTIDDNSRISQISYQTGGYRLGGILNRYNIDYKYEIVDGRRLTIPIMSPLFGSRNNSGIRDFTITSDKLQDLVFTVNGYSYNWWRSDIMVENFSRSSSYYNQTNSVLLIAGQSDQLDGNPVSFSIEGKIGGLKFKKVIAASADPYGNAETNSVQWAFRKSEALATCNYYNNQNLIKEIGKQYHIVNRQTSLLALEPGMQLWEDTIAGNVDLKTTSTVMRSESAMNDMTWTEINGASTAAYGNGIDLDGISLTDLASKNGISAVLERSNNGKNGAYSVHAVNGVINFRLPGINGEVLFQVFDLRGRLVAQKKLNFNALAGGSYSWNLQKSSNKIGKGFYLVHISGASQKKVFRISLMGR